MIKRLTALILALGVSAFVLCSCADKGGDGAETQTDDAQLLSYELERTDVIENEDCRLCVTALEQREVTDSELRAHVLWLSLENRTEETEIIFYIDSAYVNGVEWTGFYSEFVAAGESTDTSVYFATNEFGDATLDVINEIELKFIAYDNTNQEHECLGEGSVHLYPTVAE